MKDRIYNKIKKDLTFVVLKRVFFDNKGKYYKENNKKIYLKQSDIFYKALSIKKIKKYNLIDEKDIFNKDFFYTFDYLIFDDILKVLSAIKIFIRSVYNQYISYKKFLESKLSDVIK